MLNLHKELNKKIILSIIKLSLVYIFKYQNSYLSFFYQEKNGKMGIHYPNRNKP